MKMFSKTYMMNKLIFLCLVDQATFHLTTLCFIVSVVWGECNHSFHNCCMTLWVKQNNRCPLCQQDWVVQRIGK